MSTTFKHTQLLQAVMAERVSPGQGQVAGQIDNQPYFGPPLHLKEGDPSGMRPTQRRRGFVHTFDLTDEEQLEAFDALFNAATDGLAAITYQRVDFCELKGGYSAFVQGYIPYQTGPGQTALNDVMQLMSRKTKPGVVIP